MAYTERKLTTVVWDKPGNKAVGRLVRVTKVKFADGGVNFRYLVKNALGNITEFNGTTSLNNKLHADDLGCNISVEYTGEDENREVVANKNRPKVFKVLVDAESKSEVPASAFTATDEDIPF